MGRSLGKTLFDIFKTCNATGTLWNRFSGSAPSLEDVCLPSSTNSFSILTAMLSAGRDPSTEVSGRNNHLDVVLFSLMIFLLVDSSSIHSDEDNYDDIKSTVHNFQSARSQHYDQYRPAITPGGPSNPVSPSKICVGLARLSFPLTNFSLLVHKQTEFQEIIGATAWNAPNRFTAEPSLCTVNRRVLREPV